MVVIVKCIGGLSNQMAQYAFYRELISRGYKVKLDIHGFSNYILHNGYQIEKIFNLKVDYVSYSEIKKNLFYNKIKRKLTLKHGIVVQDIFSFSEYYLNVPNNSYLDGYWMSEKYWGGEG